MKAMVLHQPKTPLLLEDVPIPKPKDHEVLIKITVCAVCRTDLHIVDAELDQPKLPLILGHQIVGVIQELSPKTQQLQLGQKVGVPWLGKTCHHCPYCKENRENLCDNPTFTGYQKDGGYAEFTTAHEDFCFPLPGSFPDEQLAPLLCAGLIGYRSYRMTQNAKTIGFYGFGAAAHILIQLALYEQKEVYAFTRPGDNTTQSFARGLGAHWAGNSDESPPKPLDAAIIFAPVGNLVLQALKNTRKGSIIVCAGIHMSDIPSFPYKDLWNERCIKSVANLTREDGKEFLSLVPKIPIKTHIKRYPLEEANQALEDLRQGRINGSCVLKIS